MNDASADAPQLCHVLVEGAPQSGAWNMALDEALLEAAANSGECWLRWYRWAEPTVSLGYFQKGEIPAVFRGLSCVRRLSGGGAILHHHEWTYSFVIPSRHPLSRNPTELYGLVHDRIIGILAEFGVTAQRRGTAAAFADESFLCFQRGDANDVVVGGHKILGSAQRRRRGAVLQHGSLLMATSAHAPQLPGLSELGLSGAVSPEFETKLANATAELLGHQSGISAVPVSIKEVAAKLQSDRYQNEGEMR